jgi:hypothetical protein
MVPRLDSVMQSTCLFARQNAFNPAGLSCQPGGVCRRVINLAPGQAWYISALFYGECM